MNPKMFDCINIRWHVASAHADFEAQVLDVSPGKVLVILATWGRCENRECCTAGSQIGAVNALIHWDINIRACPNCKKRSQPLVADSRDLKLTAVNDLFDSIDRLAARLRWEANLHPGDAATDVALTAQMRHRDSRPAALEPGWSASMPMETTDGTPLTTVHFASAQNR